MLTINQTTPNPKTNSPPTMRPQDNFESKLKSGPESKPGPKCECPCRSLARWFQRAAEVGFTGTVSDLSATAFKKEIDDDWENTRDEVDFPISFEEFLAERVSPADAQRYMDELASCKCCERHQTNRPTHL